MQMPIYVYQNIVYFIINGVIKESILIQKIKKVLNGMIQNLKFHGQLKNQF